MVNEDIITGLNNAIVRGESLQNAIQILINSGYESSEVYEASKYVQRGLIPDLETGKKEYLLNQTNVVNNQIQNTPKQLNQYSTNSQQIQQNSEYPVKNIQEKTKEMPKESFKKEIILLIILIILIGVLVITILFRDKILSFFSV
jgi:ATP-dependent Zn protease